MDENVQVQEEIREETITVQQEMYNGDVILDDYYTKEEINSFLDVIQLALDGKASYSDLPNMNLYQLKITATNKLASDLVDDTEQTNLFVTSSDKSTWNGKQDALTFDTAPTASSTNPVTSDGIKTAIDNAGGGGGSTGNIVYYLDSTANSSTRKSIAQSWYDDYIAGKNPLFIFTNLIDGMQALSYIGYEEMTSGSGGIILQAFLNSYGETYYDSATGKEYRYLKVYTFEIYINSDVVSTTSFGDDVIGYIPVSYD